MLLVNRTHQRSSRWQNLIHEDEDGLLGAQLDALADYVYELTNSQVGGNEILLLVDSRDIGLLDLLADDGNAVGVFLSDTFGLSLALLEGMLVLEFGSHDGDC